MRRIVLTVVLLLSCASAAPAAEAPSAAAIQKATAAVDDARLRRAGDDTANWLTTGRTYSEERFSPLAQIDATNAAQLQPAWQFDTGTRRGLEATPIVVDGVMYVTGSWSKVFAIDAVTGKQIWAWDPKVAPVTAEKTCCDVVNRGVALYEGKVFVGVLDGRLAALRADTGELAWEVVTVDQSLPYTITGAPRIVDGKVIIGNGGAEFGVRGYVSAYDPTSGKLLWRTFTVPGDPSKPFESKALEQAAPTWKGGEWWKIGGGGTVWDSMAYDPALGLLYVGTGNGSPWVRQLRSPGGGDNLFLSSILALDPKTGEIVWHYQTTPGDNWDFTATQHMILADLDIGGKKRSVIMQAPKNGFFYVVDRKTGELISAEKYAEVTWAERVDKKTGRPVEVAGQDYAKALAIVKPTSLGAHNWQPMAFNPKTGLVYIPVQEITGAYKQEDKFTYHPGQPNTGTDLAYFSGFKKELIAGHILAWNPATQKEAWRVPLKSGWNGGMLTTAGNLVFEGNSEGNFAAYRADTGERLWQAPAGTGIIAAPVTYMVDGVQYVSVLAGWGGAAAMIGGQWIESSGVAAAPGGKVLTFALPRTASASAPATPDAAFLQGKVLYHNWCMRCHGSDAIPGGTIPDLRTSGALNNDSFVDFVLHGVPDTGMAPLGQWVTPEEARSIQKYVQARAAGAAP